MKWLGSSHLASISDILEDWTRSANGLVRKHSWVQIKRNGPQWSWLWRVPGQRAIDDQIAPDEQSVSQEWSQILPGDTREIWWALAQPLPMSTNCRMGFLRSTPQDGDLCTYWGLLWKAVGLGRGKRKSWSGQLQGNSEVQWLSEWHWVGSKWPVFQTGSWVSPWNWSTLIGMISVPGESLCWGHPDGMDV